MAEAKKCDSCGKLYEMYHDKEYVIRGKKIKGINSITIRRTEGFVDYYYDQCPECMDKVADILGIKQKDKEEQQEDQEEVIPYECETCSKMKKRSARTKEECKKGDGYVYMDCAAYGCDVNIAYRECNDDGFENYEEIKGEE